MEAFTFLKYWRPGAASDTLPSRAAAAAATTILTALPPNDTESSDDDEGPFFDLEFTVPDEEVEDPKPEEENEDDDDNINIEESSEGEREFKFTLSPSTNDRASHDLFFKGKLVHVDDDDPSSEPNSKPHFSSLLKSATKFRVFMSGLKKPKPTDKDPNPNPSPEKKSQQEKKLFTVKFRVEEVPIMSLFTRDNSSKGNNNRTHSQDSPSEEKRFSKEVMQKYFKMVKPLYVRVSRRYADKLAGKSPDKKPVPPEESAAGESETNVKSQKQGNIPAGLKVVCKHLGKSRSASSAVAAAPPPPAFVSSKRRDDSLLQQQDGIQGAILHCKRSFNASRESESSQLPRSVSDPSHEISCQQVLSRKSINEGL